MDSGRELLLPSMNRTAVSFILLLQTNQKKSSVDRKKMEFERISKDP